MVGRFTTGIDDLDPLLGGGFVKGGNVSIQHDAPEVADLLAIRLSVNVFDNLLSVTTLHRAGLAETELEAVLDRMDISLGSLLRNDQLFVLDAHDQWADQRNLFPVTDEEDIHHGFETALDRARSRGMAHMVDIETLIDLVGPDGAWELAELCERMVRGERDLLLDFLHRPPLTERQIGRYVERADQVLVIEGGDEPRLTVEKSPTGEVGATRRLERIDESPYVRLVE